MEVSPDFPGRFFVAPLCCQVCVLPAERLRVRCKDADRHDIQTPSHIV